MDSRTAHVLLFHISVLFTWLGQSMQGTYGRGLSDEEGLLKTLFADYNPSARPVMNSSNTVKVGIQFSLLHIKDLDVRSQVLTTTGLLILQWTDERLTWRPSRHGNMKELIVEAKGLWRPEFAVINGAENIYQDYDNFRAIIQHNGGIRWEPGGVFKTMCQIDITYYPFDDQVCELIFGAWSYHSSKMNLTSPSVEINLDSYKLNGEWEISGTSATRNEFFYECCPNERFSNVAFAVYMRRRHTFYIMNVILPSILTSVLLLSIFFCTPGQKVQIGVVVLLSFRIFLLNVAGNIPKTSDHIPLLGIYLTCTMAITTLSMVLTVFVLNLHHITDRPVPRWVRRVVLVYLARLLWMYVPGTQDESCWFFNRNRRKRPGSKHIYRRASVRIETDGDERTAIIELHPRCSSSSNRDDRNGVSHAPENLFSDSEREYQSIEKPECSNYKGTSSPSKPAKAAETPDFSKDWQRVAEVFDRLFFWLFLLAILISTLVLFHPLTDAYLRRGK